MESTNLNLLDLVAEARARAESRGMEAPVQDPFLDVACEILQEHGELDEYQPLATGGIKGGSLAAFHFEEEENRLDLFSVISSTDGKFGTPDLRKAVQRAVKVLDFANSRRDHPSSEEGMAEFCEALKKSVNRTSRIRLLVLSASEGARGLEVDEPTVWNSHPIEVRLWDSAKLERLLGSGAAREGIRVELGEFPLGAEGVLMLHSGIPNRVYETYLAFLPGDLLADVYRKFGARLLERNVRSFLQVRGKVNKGIRETIRLDPGMFLAYNNGLAVTVTGMEGRKEGDAFRATAFADFQIVNGGQTTASLSKAKQDGLSMDGISVQVKFAHLKNVDGDREEELIGNIARYANSQNKIRDTDLASSYAFYRKLEELSRAVVARPRRGKDSLTYWFFERSRGQYLTEKNAFGRGAKLAKFLKENPREQLITTSDVAKFEHTWDCRPHDVSRGSQKNFLMFQEGLEERRTLPDEAWFRRLVAKAILFKATDQVVRQQNFGGYKANITAYTLAWVAHRTGRGIDLEAIWNAQECPGDLIQVLAKASYGVDRLLRDSHGRNVTENAKRKETWDRIAQDDLGLDPDDLALLEEIRQRVANRNPGEQLAELDEDERRMVQEVMAHPASMWMELVMWSKQTDVLQGWQRSILFSVARRLQTGLPPSVKQAKQVLKALDQAREKGFAP